MKAISLWQPWASALFIVLPDGSRLKTNETRGWATKHRGRLAIHAAKTFPSEAKSFTQNERAFGRLPDVYPLFTYGAIIGTVNVLGMRRTEDIVSQVSALERLYGDYSPGRWAWITSDQILFDEPIPFKGKQGFFNVPDEILPHINPADICTDRELLSKARAMSGEELF
ncbi:MAG: hypothetical protein ABFD62_05025 [Syntrophaceae bacterium]